jgi:hypothetical protein
MADDELYILLSNADVDKDIYLSTWREENPDKKYVEVVSVNDAESKLKEKKLTKLTLMITKYETTKKFEQLWEEFQESFKSLTEPLQTLHFILLAQGVEKLARDIEKVLILKTREFFKNLQCETIEFDCKFTVSLNSGWSQKFLESLGQICGTRVRLGSATTSVIVRNPNAQIIQLYNDDFTQFRLVKIYLITESYPMALILYNVNPNVIKDKKLEVYWNGKELMIFQLKNYGSTGEQVIHMKLPPLPFLDTKLPPPPLSVEKSTQPGFRDCTIFDCCFGEEFDV